MEIPNETQNAYIVNVKGPNSWIEESKTVMSLKVELWMICLGSLMVTTYWAEKESDGGSGSNTNNVDSIQCEELTIKMLMFRVLWNQCKRFQYWWE